jgi:hypothetical protein
VTGANKSQVSSFALRAQKYVQTTNDSVGESGGVGSDDGNTTGWTQLFIIHSFQLLLATEFDCANSLFPVVHYSFISVGPSPVRKLTINKQRTVFIEKFTKGIGTGLYRLCCFS